MPPKSFVLLFWKCTCSSLQLTDEQDLRNLANTKVKTRLKIASGIDVRHFENCDYWAENVTLRLHEKRMLQELKKKRSE